MDPSMLQQPHCCVTVHRIAHCNMIVHSSADDMVTDASLGDA